tara:strand:- start:40410 stop:40910 length:501 start_codon:yes stop_codon:yes gene_type:complete
MNYFSNGSKRFLLQTKNMESYKDYVYVNKDYNNLCFMDTILYELEPQFILKDSVYDISFFYDSVLVINYNNLGDSVFEISSQKLIHYVNKDIIELTNNVQLKNYNGDLLKTNQLFWNIENNNILSLDTVSIKTSDKVINGCGFYSDDNFENYKIFNINGIIQIDQE